MASKFVIILEKNLATGLFSAVLWADVPVGRQAFYAKPGAVSAWPGASAGENAALASGAVAEQVTVLTVSDGATLAQLKTAAVAQWAAFQAFVTAYNPWSRYGSFYDGTTWTAGGAI